ncbi:MAG: hypothetical protein MRY77_00625 [Rhodobacteraceae bacterium]|nr:hypothetical protein [Paracoccaceae bacterium]
MPNMNPRTTRIGLTAFACAAALSLSAGPSVAADFASQCEFTHVVKVTSAGMQRADVRLPVSLTRKNRSGRVLVSGSGDYKARAKTFKSGALEYVFKTGVSKETITIGPRGEALWEISFKNGDLMTYVGSCGEERKTS